MVLYKLLTIHIIKVITHKFLHDSELFVSSISEDLSSLKRIQKYFMALTEYKRSQFLFFDFLLKKNSLNFVQFKDRCM